MAENLRLDHVSIGSGDLDATARWLESTVGFRTIEAWIFSGGMANRIAYSGGTAVEILGAAFPGMEMINALAAQIHGRTIARDVWLTWALASDDIEATASRLGLEVMDGSAFSISTGEPITWRMCGVVEAFFSEPYLPFFLSYVGGEEGWRQRAIQPEPAFDVARITLAGDPDRLRQWVGDADLPVDVTTGPPEMLSVALKTPNGEIDLKPDRL
jgi:catechol 2,3-dioxygenase-like lactoylglutathione lyase family enzyme